MNTIKMKLKDIKEKKNKLFSKILKIKLNSIIWFIIFLLLILSIIGPYLFSLASYKHWVEFDETTAHVGDTIGGITSPFVNLIAAALVYLSFNEQIKANQITSKIFSNQLNFSGVDYMITLLEKSIDGFYFEKNNNHYNGQTALQVFITHFNEHAKSNQLYELDDSISGGVIKNNTIIFMKKNFIQTKLLFKIFRTTRIAIERIENLDTSESTAIQMRHDYTDRLILVFTINDIQSIFESIIAIERKYEMSNQNEKNESKEEIDLYTDIKSEVKIIVNSMINLL